MMIAMPTTSVYPPGTDIPDADRPGRTALRPVQMRMWRGRKLIVPRRNACPRVIAVPCPVPVPFPIFEDDDAMDSAT